MTVLDTPRAASLEAAAPTGFVPTAILPIVIERPRGGMLPATEARRPPVSRSTPSARDIVLGAIWPLLRETEGPAPSAATTTIADAAVARVRALIANAVTGFRVRLGGAASGFKGADRFAVEDCALTLKVDEVALLDRTVGLLSPQALLGAAISGHAPAAEAIERTVASHVDMQMLALVRAERRLGETAKARLLSVLCTNNA